MLVITGGGGFIGSVLAAALNAAGRSDLVIVDRFGTGDKWRNIAKRDFSDILPVEGLPAWLDRYGTEVEAVFHLGANSSTFEEDADEIIATNLNASIALWRWCATAGKPLIYASSAATYGDGSAGFDDGGDISGEARSFLDLMKALGRACGVAPHIEFIDMPPGLGPNYQYFTEARMSRLRQAGYNAPFTPLEDAVADFVTQYLAQPDPYL